jgi:hypothetical protein
MYLYQGTQQHTQLSLQGHKPNSQRDHKLSKAIPVTGCEGLYG